MPSRTAPPSYRHHKARNCAVVTINGRNHYLGPFGSPESYERYARLIAGCRAVPGAGSRPISDLSVTSLIALYWPYAKGYYVKNGRPTGRLASVRASLRVLRALFGSTPATSFGPLALRAIQQHLIDDGKSRNYINDLSGNIRRVFKWAVAEELLSASVYQALQAVSGLKKGRTGARETAPVGPVDDAAIEATLPFLPKVVADMVRFQRLTGCRPCEVCLIRPMDIDRTGEVWVYRPASHKTEHHGHERAILVGPKGQAVLAAYLERAPDAYCFSPRESEALRRAEQRAARKSKVQPSQSNRAKPKRKVVLRDRYSKDSYGWAIRRACDRADRIAREKRQGVEAEPRLVDRWHPNQLRHTAATEIRRTFGLEAAQVCLGHRRASVTEIYAERDLALARTAMQSLG